MQFARERRREVEAVTARVPERSLPRKGCASDDGEVSLDRCGKFGAPLKSACEELGVAEIRCHVD